MKRSISMNVVCRASRGRPTLIWDAVLHNDFRVQELSRNTALECIRPPKVDGWMDCNDNDTNLDNSTIQFHCYYCYSQK